MERIQVQQLAVGTDIGVQTFIILKRLPFQFHIGAVMICLGADEELDLQLVQRLMGQRKIIGGIRRCGLNGQDIPVNPLNLLQVRHRVIDISGRYCHIQNDAAVRIYRLVRDGSYVRLPGQSDSLASWSDADPF